MSVVTIKGMPQHKSRLLEMAQHRLMLEEFLVRESDINIRDEQGKNALYWAINTSHKHNTKMLLEYGIDLVVESGIHALYHTIMKGDYETFTLLLELGEDINMRNPQGQTLLMCAVQQENVMMVRYLINHGADLYALDNQQHSVLEYAQNAKDTMVYNLVHYRILFESMERKEVA